MKNKPIGIKQIQKRQTRVSKCADMSKIALDESNASICNDDNLRNQYIESVFSNCTDEESSSKYLNVMINHINECTDESIDARHSSALINTMVNEVIPSMSSDALKSEAFDNLLYGKDDICDAINEALYCDRVIENNKKISKRFNADIYVREHQFYTNHHKMYRTICEWINTYNMPGYAKLSTAIDEISYLFQKNAIRYDSKDMVKYVTEFYTMDPERDNTATTKRLCNALENNMMISDSDLDQVRYLFEGSANEENSIESIINKCKSQDKLDDNTFISAIKKIYVDSPSNIINGTPNVLKWIRQLVIMSTLGINVVLGAITIAVDKFIELNLNRKEIMRVHSIFSKEKERVDELIEQEDDPEKYDNLKKYSDKLDGAIASIYSKADSVMDSDELMDQENTLESVRKSVPVLYENINFSDINDDFKKISDAICTKYKDNLLKHGASLVLPLCIGTGQHHSNIRIDTNTTSTTGMYDCVILILKSDSASDLEDLRSFVSGIMLPDIREGSPYKFYINTSATEIEIHAVYYSQIIMNDETAEFTKEHSFSNADLNRLYEFYHNCNIINRLESANPASIVNDLVESNLGANEVSAIIEMSKYVAADGPFSNDDDWMKIVNKYYQPYNESDNESDYANKVANNNALALSAYSIGNSKKDYPIDIQLEAYENMRKIINEGIDFNGVKIALQGMKDKVKTLSTKEKEASNNIDIAANNFIKSAQSALTNNRREAIIKGSVIPSFSKCLKAALGLTVVGAVTGPAVAVISAFGGLAISKHLNDRERVLMLDEIETELQVVEKELQMAENDNDMNRYRKLLTYQKRLKKEAFKIRYKLSRKAKRNLVTRGSEDGTRED